MHLPGRVPPLRVLDLLLLATLATGLVALSLSGVAHGTWGYDAYAYWSVDPAHPYAMAMNVHGAYLYAPVFLPLTTLFGLLPYPVFLTAWTALLLATLAWLGRGWGAVLFLVPVVAFEVLAGNINLLIAAALVIGLARPAAWAFILLTKVTPGVCLLWFAARREWRSIGIALGVTAAIAGISLVVAPGAWAAWLERLWAEAQRADPGPWAALAGPLWARLLIAGVISFVAGARGLRWPLAIALTLAMPNPSPQTLAILTALVPLVALDRSQPLERRSALRAPTLRVVGSSAS
jgi:hypothetical protein